jgi:hypothetical protein
LSDDVGAVIRLCCLIYIAVEVGGLVLDLLELDNDSDELWK